MTIPSTAEFAPAPSPRDGRPGLPAALAITVGVFVLIGVIVGLIWPHLVAQPKMVMTGDIGLQPVDDDEAGKLVTMDGWYALLGMVSCLVAGAVLYTVFRRFGAWTVLAQFVGAGAGALLAVVVGTMAGNNEIILAWRPEAAVGTAIEAPVALHAFGAMALWPFAAVLPIVPLIFLLWVADGQQSSTTHRSQPSGGHLVRPMR